MRTCILQNFLTYIIYICLLFICGISMLRVNPGNFEVHKHPLNNSWTLWFYMNEKKKDWEHNMHKIFTFSNVEDFWCLIRNIKSPSELPNGHEYMIFKSNICPMWEDNKNQKGGRWLINLKDAHTSDAELDEMWKELVNASGEWFRNYNFNMMFIIGENFEESDEICGAFVYPARHKRKLTVWTADYEHTEINMAIGKHLKKILKISDDMKITYDKHY